MNGIYQIHAQPRNNLISAIQRSNQAAHFGSGVHTP
jgi:hypothetical protein